jgi:hypothetical protein
MAEASATRQRVTAAKRYPVSRLTHHIRWLLAQLLPWPC